MGLFSWLTGRGNCNKGGDSWHEMATDQLIEDLNHLLVEGYEKEPGISARGPLVAKKNRGEEIALFSAVMEEIVARFVRRRDTWRKHEGKTIDCCRRVLTRWAKKHGATAEEIADKSEAVRLAQPLLSILIGDLATGSTAQVDATASQMHDWVSANPDRVETLGSDLALIFRYSCEYGVVEEFLGDPTRLYNALDN